MTELDAPAPKTSWREIMERCLHVVALASLTVAQPLLDLLARHAEFLVAHRFTRADVFWLLAGLLVLVPLPAVVLEIALKPAPTRLGAAVHGLIVAGLAALFWILTTRRQLELPPAPTLAAAAAAGILFAAVYSRARWLRFFVSALALAIVAAPAAFLASPQVAKITSGRKASFHQLPPVESTAPIVFVIFDEFPVTVLLDAEGAINRHRYPNFARLAETATWFANAASAAEISEAAIPAIVAGAYPRPGALPTSDDYPRNLFTLFGGDYEVWAREPMSALCPPELNRLTGDASAPSSLRAAASDLGVVYLHLVVPAPYRARLPPIDAGWRDFAPRARRSEPGKKGRKKSFFAMAVEATRRDRREEFEALTAAVGEDRGPGLYFLHVLLPHRPWEFTPQGHRYPGGDSIPGLAGSKWLGDEYLVRQAYQRLIAQTRFVDAAVGRLIDRLEAAERFDRSLIVLAGDHGASFRPGDTRRLLSRTNAHDVIPVPLLIKLPGQRRARRVEHPVSVVDVLPTVLEALEIKPPWELEGRSGFDPRPRQIRFATKKRGTLDVHPAVHREKYATVRWKLEHFGDGSDPLDLYRLGPAGELVGRPASELAERGEAAWAAAIDGIDAFERVSLDDGVPVFVTGQLAGGDPAEPCCRLAVALNGTVYGTARTHAVAGRRRDFSVLLPFEGFREGANRLEVYRLLGDAAAPDDVGGAPLRYSPERGVEARRLPLRAAEG